MLETTMNLLILDTETTGNVPGEDRLVSVAYKIGADLKHELFKPAKEISIDAMCTHHITSEMVADKPPLVGSDMYRELERLLVDHILVAHNAAFDIAMLEAEGLTVPQFICTLKVARALDADGTLPRYSLQYLRYALKLPVTGVVPHSADGDVSVLAALFTHLQQQAAQQYETPAAAIAAMMEISVKPSLIHHFGFGKYRGQRLGDVALRDPGYLEWLLSAKEADQSNQYGNDADLIYSLRQALGRK